MSTVSDWHIEHHGGRQVDDQRVVLGYFVDNVLRGAGELVFDAGPVWRGGSEAALSVESAWQNCGVGSELLRRLLMLTRNRASSPLRIVFVRENRRIASLARNSGMHLRSEGSSVAATARPGWPNQFSLLEEGLHDSHATWVSWFTAPLEAVH